MPRCGWLAGPPAGLELGAANAHRCRRSCRSLSSSSHSSSRCNVLMGSPTALIATITTTTSSTSTTATTTSTTKRQQQRRHSKTPTIAVIPVQRTRSAQLAAFGCSSPSAEWSRTASTAAGGRYSDRNNSSSTGLSIAATAATTATKETSNFKPSCLPTVKCSPSSRATSTKTLALSTTQTQPQSSPPAPSPLPPIVTSRAPSLTRRLSLMWIYLLLVASSATHRSHAKTPTQKPIIKIGV